MKRNPFSDSSIRFFILAILVFFFIICGCSKNQSTESVTVTDVDGNVYKTVKIGDQWWMAENLKVTHYRNGDEIPYIMNNEKWYNSGSVGACCSYENDDNNKSTYGLLYNAYAVQDKRGLAPEGWHIPTDEDWMILEMNLGMNESECQKYGFRTGECGGLLKSKGTKYWREPNTGATNETGFSALPGGCRESLEGIFKYRSAIACFWTSTGCSKRETSGHILRLDSKNHSWFRQIRFDRSSLNRFSNRNLEGYSVRCVRDN